MNKLLNGFDINNKVKNHYENENNHDNINQKNKNNIDINDLIKFSGGNK